MRLYRLCLSSLYLVQLSVDVQPFIVVARFIDELNVAVCCLLFAVWFVVLVLFCVVVVVVGALPR